MDLRNKLLLEASKYATEEEFKAKNLPKYLLAVRKRLIKVAFPPEAIVSRKIKGIFYLYQDKKVVYIGYSVLDTLQAIAEHKETLVLFNNYKIFASGH